MKGGGVMVGGKEVVKEVAQAIPPVTVTTTCLMGIPLQHWVYIVTVIYTAIQIARLFPKCYGCMRCFIDHGTCPRTCKD